jgi:hypothetical protein
MDFQDVIAVSMVECSKRSNSPGILLILHLYDPLGKQSGNP